LKACKLRFVVAAHNIYVYGIAADFFVCIMAYHSLMGNVKQLDGTDQFSANATQLAQFY
jgi:hypothetical protein